MTVERFDTLERGSKGVLENILGQFGHREAWKNGLAIELVSEPLEDDPGGLSVTLTDTSDDVAFVLDWGQIAGVLASQGCLLSSPPFNGGRGSILHNELVDAAMCRIPE